VVEGVWDDATGRRLRKRAPPPWGVPQFFFFPEKNRFLVFPGQAPERAGVFFLGGGFFGAPWGKKNPPPPLAADLLASRAVWSVCNCPYRGNGDSGGVVWIQ